MRLPFEFERARVQLLGDQCPAAQPQQIALAVASRRVQRVGVRGQQPRPCRRLGQRGRIDTSVLRLPALDRVQEAAAGKHPRPAMEAFAARGIQRSKQRWCSTGCGHLEQAAGQHSIQDAAVAAPRPASGRRHVADYQWRPARQIDSSQLASREEGDGLAVRGPERIGGALGSGDQPRRRAVQGPEPQSALPGARSYISCGPAVRG